MLSDSSVMLTAPAISSIAWTVTNAASNSPAAALLAKNTADGTRISTPFAAMIFMRSFLRCTAGLRQPLPSENPDAPATAIDGTSTSMPARMPFLTAVMASTPPNNSVIAVAVQNMQIVISAKAPAKA
jgi:hypothetical protein